MKYSPRELSGNVNVSRSHPLTELAWMVGGLITIVVVVSLAFWWLTDLIVPHVPADVEVWAGKHFMEKLDCRDNQDLSRILAKLVKALPADSPLRRYDFRVSTVENETVNALALPGGKIVVFSGLLKQTRSENELAMVLGHELGHYANRDHLRGLGRGLGVTLALAMLFGQESPVAGVASNLFLDMEMCYSQQQESAADAFGLEMLVAGYGHAGGAVDFFSRLAEKAGGKYSYALASHPHPEDRIFALRKMIATKGYPVRESVPFAEEGESGRKE